MKKAIYFIIFSGLVLSTIIGCAKKQDSTCPGYALYIPNSFSPNGDGRDDIYRPKQGDGLITNYQMLIFNSSGNQIYKTTDLNDGWDGAVQGDTVICQQGTYIYQIKATDGCGNQHLYTGNLYLLK